MSVALAAKVDERRHVRRKHGSESGRWSLAYITWAHHARDRVQFMEIYVGVLTCPIAFFRRNSLAGQANASSCPSLRACAPMEGQRADRQWEIAGRWKIFQARWGAGFTMRGATNDESTMRFSGGGPDDTLPITTRVPPSTTSFTTPLNHPVDMTPKTFDVKTATFCATHGRKFFDACAE